MEHTPDKRPAEGSQAVEYVDPNYARGVRKTPVAPPSPAHEFADHQTDLPEDELEADADFARGQREMPKNPAVKPDFARGQREIAQDPETDSDFARGQRETSEDPSIQPDFARGQDHK